MLTELIEYDKQLLLSWGGSESLFLDSVVMTLTTATTWIPLYVALLYIVMKNSDTSRNVLAIIVSALLCILLAGTVDDAIIKPLIARWRPARDPEIGMLVDVVNHYRGGRFGFFSAHASNTFSIAVFFSLLIRNKVMTVGMVAWSLINGWTRIYLGVHFPGDVLVGLLWGAVVGTSVYLLYRRVLPRMTTVSNFVSSQYTSTGYQVDHVNIVISVLCFTLAYAMIKACLVIVLM